MASVQSHLQGIHKRIDSLVGATSELRASGRGGSALLESMSKWQTVVATPQISQGIKEVNSVKEKVSVMENEVKHIKETLTSQVSKMEQLTTKVEHLTTLMDHLGRGIDTIISQGIGGTPVRRSDRSDPRVIRSPPHSRTSSSYHSPPPQPSRGHHHYRPGHIGGQR